MNINVNIDMNYHEIIKSPKLRKIITKKKT